MKVSASQAASVTTSAGYVSTALLSSGGVSADRQVTFPKARQGYQRSAVDAFVAEVKVQLETLKRENVSLEAATGQLNEALTQLQGKYQRLETAEVDERAQDVLDAAQLAARSTLAEAQRAADEIVRLAEQQAAVVNERARQEFAWSKRQLRSEQALLNAQQQVLRDQLRSLRALADDSAGAISIRDFEDTSEDHA